MNGKKEKKNFTLENKCWAKKKFNNDKIEIYPDKKESRLLYSWRIENVISYIREKKKNVRRKK